MKYIQHIHHQITVWQSKTWSKIILTAVFVGLVLAILIPLQLAVSSLHTNRNALYGVLNGPEQRLAAQQLEETGFVQIDNVSFGDERLKGFRVLGDNGKVIDPASVTSLILQSHIPRWVPPWLMISPSLIWILALISIAWFGISIWLELFASLVYALILGFGGWYIFVWFGLPKISLAIAGMCILGFSYNLLIKLLLLLFQSPKQVPTIARGVLLESTRTRISIAFLAILLIVLPLIPIMLDPASPLRHRMQTLLSRSLGTTFGIAAFLTVFLCCATVAFEIRDRQIWQVLTKPVSRFGYLFGKWIGVLAINLSILVVASASVFMYVQYLRTTPVAEGIQGELDRIAVEEEILTARVGSEPIYETLSEEQLSTRVEQMIEEDPELRDVENIQVQLRIKLRDELQEQFLAYQRSIPPRVNEQVFSQTYTFEGLEHAKKTGTPLAFRYRFHIGESDEQKTFEAGFVYNEDPTTKHIVSYVPTMTHVTMVPAYLINENGELKITIFNLFQEPGPNERYEKGTLSFDKGGVELLYRVGDFEGNYFRAMLLLFIKLAFLTALALASATFLSFPVACTVTLTVFACATLAPYLSTALQAYVPPETSKVDFSSIEEVIKWSFENIVRAIASTIVFLLDGFGEQRPTDQLVNGLLVSWGTVLRGLATIGLVWSGAALLIGSYVLKKRQLAIYSGKG